MRFRRIISLFLVLVCIITVPFSAVADETQEEAAAAESEMTPEELADYVAYIIEYLSAYGYENAQYTKMYRAALDAAIENDPELYDEIMTAILSSIDENSAYYPSGEYAEFVNSLEGSVGGIGVSFVIDEEGRAAITGVVDGGAAQAAGIQAGDIIYSVDGVVLENVSTEEVQSVITGTIGTTVNIGIVRDGAADVIYYDLTRAEIGERLSVTGTIVGTGEDATMYIKIYSFMTNTYDLFTQELEKADEQGIKNLIIDVRDNGGGYLDQAILIANLFVPSGELITKEDHKIDLLDVEFRSTNERTQTYDIVMLGNENSASASEVLTAALTENDLATLVGTTTYGKGTVQELVPLKDDEMMKFTVAYYLTPDGNNIDKVGLSPDVYVENETKYLDLSEYGEFGYTTVYSVGDSSADIELAKTILSLWGLYGGEINETYDEELAAAVQLFQASTGLYPYGVLDITTQLEIYNQLRSTTYVDDNQLETALNHFGLSLDEEYASDMGYEYVG